MTFTRTSKKQNLFTQFMSCLLFCHNCFSNAQLLLYWKNSKWNYLNVSMRRKLVQDPSIFFCHMLSYLTFLCFNILLLVWWELSHFTYIKNDFSSACCIVGFLMNLHVCIKMSLRRTTEFNSHYYNNNILLDTLPFSVNAAVIFHSISRAFCYLIALVLLLKCTDHGMKLVHFSLLNEREYFHLNKD